jgi:hypothetical protein
MVTWNRHSGFTRYPRLRVAGQGQGNSGEDVAIVVQWVRDGDVLSVIFRSSVSYEHAEESVRNVVEREMNCVLSHAGFIEAQVT